MMPWICSGFLVAYLLSVHSCFNQSCKWSIMRLAFIVITCDICLLSPLNGWGKRHSLVYLFLSWVTFVTREQDVYIDCEMFCGSHKLIFLGLLITSLSVHCPSHEAGGNWNMQQSYAFLQRPVVFNGFIPSYACFRISALQNECSHLGFHSCLCTLVLKLICEMSSVPLVGNTPQSPVEINGTVTVVNFVHVNLLYLPYWISI